MEGKLETNMRFDNRLNSDQVLLEERGDFLFSDDNLKFGLSMAVGDKSGNTKTEVHQLYMEKYTEYFRNIVKAGRFERADAAGYYILDGASLRNVDSKILLEVYGGRSVRVEDYLTEEEEISVGGIEVEFPGESLWPFHGRVGYQKVVQGDSRDGISWGARVCAGNSDDEEKYYEIITQGKAIPESKEVENFLLEVKSQFLDRKMAVLGYEIYDLSKDTPSLRNNFYKLYGGGKEKSLKGALSFNLSKRVSIHGSGRSVARLSQRGYTGAFGAEYEREDGLTSELEINIMYLDGEVSRALFASYGKPLTPRVITKLTGVLQVDESRTIPENRGYGFEAFTETMFKDDLFLSFSTMYVWNSFVENEYMLALSLKKYFNYNPGGGA